MESICWPNYRLNVPRIDCIHVGLAVREFNLFAIHKQWTTFKFHFGNNYSQCILDPFLLNHENEQIFFHLNISLLRIDTYIKFSLVCSVSQTFRCNHHNSSKIKWLWSWQFASVAATTLDVIHVLTWWRWNYYHELNLGALSKSKRIDQTPLKCAMWTVIVHISRSVENFVFALCVVVCVRTARIQNLWRFDLIGSCGTLFLQY